MRKGMTATQVIVALALGLIVIVGLGYLIWTWMGRGGGQVSEEYCRAKLFTFCSEKSIGGFKETTPAKFKEDNPECEIYSWVSEIDESKCREVLGLKATT